MPILHLLFYLFSQQASGECKIMPFATPTVSALTIYRFLKLQLW
jgi:hypothetical protein